jgi:hypothetical protein
VTRIISWKKMMLLAALLAMLIVAAVPAIAQIGQEAEQESESGQVDLVFRGSRCGRQLQPVCRHPGRREHRQRPEPDRPDPVRLRGRRLRV